jgi:hypothetical protein
VEEVEGSTCSRSAPPPSAPILCCSCDAAAAADALSLPVPTRTIAEAEARLLSEEVQVCAPSDLPSGYELTVDVNGCAWTVLVVRRTKF